MSGSLQDQLLKVGLVTEEQLKDAREKPKGPGKGALKKKGGRRKSKGKGRGPGPEGHRAAAPAPKLRAASPPKGGDSLSPEERALRKRVHAMIAESTVARDDGEVAYHFIKGSRIKRLYVTGVQREGLAAGEFAVAAMKGRHYLIPMTTAQAVKALIPEYFIAMGNSQDPTDTSTEVDDEYAEYQVPDDLTW